MFPLLKKDLLILPYVVTLALWNWLAYSRKTDTSVVVKAMEWLSYAFMILLHLLEFQVPAPANLPDFYVVANVELSTALFGLIVLYFNYRQFTLPTAGVEASRDKPKRQ
ncbi:Glucosyltransferase-like protein [Rhizophlyctis rosea]|nr:Glucosyltransferase-like protein [Rhizophlyctis rosea]